MGFTEAELRERLGKPELQNAYEKVGQHAPDGTYQAIVRRFDFIETKDGILKLLTELEVAFGEWQGATVETWHDVEDPGKVKYLSDHLEGLGLPVLTDYADLVTILPTALSKPVEIALKTSDKGYQNVYVNKSLGDPIVNEMAPDTEGLPAAASKSDDDIGF